MIWTILRIVYFEARIYGIFKPYGMDYGSMSNKTNILPKTFIYIKHSKT